MEQLPTSIYSKYNIFNPVNHYFYCENLSKPVEQWERMSMEFAMNNNLQEELKNVRFEYFRDPRDKVMNEIFEMK